MKQIKFAITSFAAIAIALFSAAPAYAESPVLMGGERIRTDAQVQSLNISWYYNYTPAASVSSAEFVPMIRDEGQLGRLGELAGTTGWVLGFNEAGVETQAETLDTPIEIARAWRRLVEALPNARLYLPPSSTKTRCPGRERYPPLPNSWRLSR
jgi:hypothetical protein